SEQTRPAVPPPGVLVAARPPIPETKALPAKAVPAKRAAAARPASQGLADGSLSGIVSDGTGAVVPGVTVTVSSMAVTEGVGVAETAIQKTFTGEAGYFVFPALPAGQY